MKRVFRYTTTFAVASALGLCLGFAALAQDTLGMAAKTHEWNQARLSSRIFPLPQRGCFCDADCLAKIARQERSWFFAGRRASYLTPESDIPVIDLNGLKKLLQRDPKDTRPLLINFWATWCDPCREEFPDLVKIDTDYPAARLNFVAVSLDELADIKSAVPKFLKEMKATMPVVLLNVNDPEPAIKIVDAAWDGQLPATFLYDTNGKIVFRHFGRIKPDELRAAIDKTVSKQP